MQNNPTISVRSILIIIKVIIFINLLSEFIFIVCAQDKPIWHDKKCAVVLTYDDALNVHLDNAIPLLDSLKFKATFYLPGFSPSIKERSRAWAEAAREGHELGNHTLFHPCEGKAQGREWVKPEYNLSTYTSQRITDEILMTNVLLELINGKSKRTFAYPCGDMKAGDSSYVSLIRNNFTAARGVQAKMQKIDEIDLFDICCFMINGQTGNELTDLVKKAVQTNSLLVFLFHGVGCEHDINVSLPAHRQLLFFLEQNENQIMKT
jgi:peptidoglycan/xylan/chitin deacetylase (PgdA/CDA1 family)